MRTCERPHEIGAEALWRAGPGCDAERPQCLTIVGKDEAAKLGSATEVQEQSDLDATRAEIIQKLSFVHPMQSATNLELDAHFLVNQEIDSEPANAMASERDLDRHLALHAAASFLERNGHGCGVHGLQEAVSKFGVDLLEGMNHFSRDAFVKQ
jgi:hypothetical protein